MGQARLPARAELLAAAPIVLDGTRSGAGGVSGGLVGAGVGLGSSNAPAAALVGLLVGAVVGAVVEEAATRRPAFEYVVKLDGGGVLTVVQPDDIQRRPGDAVLVHYGPPMYVRAM